MPELPLLKTYGYNRIKLSSLTFDELKRLEMYVKENHILPRNENGTYMDGYSRLLREDKTRMKRNILRFLAGSGDLLHCASLKA